MFLARTPSRARRLALGMCLAASLALSACGPAHKGQLKVEPADASAEASAEASESSSPTPSKSPSPTASASTPSPSATTWTAPSVTVSSEDSSVWTHDDERIKKDSAGPNGTIDGYTVNANPACFGYVSTSAEERYYSLRGVGDDIQSKAALKSQQTIFSGYQTTQGPNQVDAVTVNFSDAPNTPMDGYRFDRRVGEKGFALEVMLLCPQGSLIGLDQWHTILGGIRLQGIDAGAM